MEVEAPTMAGSTIKLTVKFGGNSIPLSVSPDVTVKDLKSLFSNQSPTFFLVARNSSSKQSKVGDGAKIMLMASQGLHQGLEGWDEFDERRRTKHQKQLDFRVVGSGKFDEGADKSW